MDGATLTLTYDEDLDENSEPSSDAFSVTVGGTGRAVDGVSVAGSAVTLTLASAVTAENMVTASYTLPSDAAAPRILDLAGNAAASFNDRAVVNNTPVANTPATGLPTISGTVQVGETLSVDTSGIDDADGMSGAVFSYQWLANGAEITGATDPTYTLVGDDKGKSIKVRVIFTDNADNEETLTSDPTAAVDPRPNSPATGAPTISGTVRVGEILTAHTSDIADPDGLNNVGYNFNWGCRGLSSGHGRLQHLQGSGPRCGVDYPGVGGLHGRRGQLRDTYQRRHRGSRANDAGCAATSQRLPPRYRGAGPVLGSAHCGLDGRD